MDGFAKLIGSEVWDGLVSLGAPDSYLPGEILLRQGERTDHVLLLLAGRVKVSLVDEDGNSLLLAVRGPGEVLGEVALIDGRGRSATVTAMDVCDVRVISWTAFIGRLRHLRCDEELVRFALRRFRENEALRLELATLPAGVRVLRGLLRLGVPVGPGEPVVDVGLSQIEFGEAIGLSRASVADKLGELRSEGLVSTRRGRIVIEDLARLRRLAEE